jgi:endonuclease/exonuclease/phosphatase family metal-dependent hydrolase
MTNFFKEAKPYQYLIWSTLILATIFVIYTPEQFVFKKLAKYGVQLMIVCLGLGFFFLMNRDTKSMWVSLACCSVLCFQLRTREPFYPIKYGAIFKIAQVNLSNSSDYELTIKTLIDSRADILSLQDLDLNWDFILKEKLLATYPYEKSIIGLGVYNVAVYSKHPFTEVDTFYYKDAPNIHGCVEIDNQKVHFITSMTVPPVDMNAFQEIESHLLSIAKYSTKINAPLITLGNYNVVPQSSEINKLKQKGNLHDSRTNQSLIAESPVDHILYSKELECTDFTTLAEGGKSKIGIMGTYQFNRKYVNAKINQGEN